MSRLPDKLDPQRAADQERVLEGALGRDRLVRLASLAEDHVEAAFGLIFFRDDKRRCCVRGSVRVRVRLICQRCLGSVEVEVDSQLLAAIVRSSDEAQRLPEQYDPVYAEDGMLDLVQMIEDEIILSLPQIAMHAEGECAPARREFGTDAETDRNPDADGKDHPFAVLAQLKKQMH